MKKRTLAPSENQVDRQIYDGLCLLIAPPGIASRYGVVWYAIEHRNARDAVEGAKRKARGVVAGIPDKDFYYQGRCLKIETKRNSKKAFSPKQRDLRSELAKAGIAVELACSLDGVLEVLDAHGFPHSGSRRTHTDAPLAEAERLHVAAVGNMRD